MGSSLEQRHHVPRHDIETRKQPDDLETYQHSPLGDSEIRLLVVEPATDESNIVKATLRTVSFAEDATHKYNAVSYCWGDEDRRKKILLRCASGDWKNFCVKPNLHSLLQHLRLPDQPTTFWIDAICIDQDSDKEKRSQIGKMAQIYQKADEVSIWLGEHIGSPYTSVRRCDRETSKAIFDFISTAVEHGKEVVMKNHSSGWRQFILLMKVPWFSRRWVLQELAFARNPMMYFGSEKISWETFKSAIEVFTNHFDDVVEIAWPESEWLEAEFPALPNPDRLEVNWANPLEVIPLAAFMENVFEKNTQFPVFTLEALVASMAVFQTSDPRDVIYALLSVAKDRLVEPDYTANVSQIYANFVEKVINTSESLDIICRRWAAKDRRWDVENVEQEPFNLSSWMRQTDGSIFDYKKYLISPRRRSNPDPLVGMPGRSPYAACADRKAAIHMGGQRRLLESTGSSKMGVNVFHTLYAKGVVIGTVSFDKGPRPRRSAFIKSVGDSFAQDPTPAMVPEKLWRTLVVDRAFGGGPAPGWYGDTCLYCLMQVDRDPNVLFCPWVSYWPKGPNYAGRCPDDVIEFRQRVTAVVSNQTAFDGDPVDGNKEKLFGIGSRGMKAGDKICILFGCSVPVILRPTEDVDGNECFICLGESFVYNMMNGEALKGLTNDQVKEFAIV